MPTRAEKIRLYKMIAIGIVISVAIGALIAFVGCGKPLFTAQVGSASQPAAVITASAPAITFPPKMIELTVNAPVQQEFDLGRISIVIGVIVALVIGGIVLFFRQPPGSKH